MPFKSKSVSIDAYPSRNNQTFRVKDGERLISASGVIFLMIGFCASAINMPIFFVPPPRSGCFPGHATRLPAIAVAYMRPRMELFFGHGSEGREMARLCQRHDPRRGFRVAIHRRNAARHRQSRSSLRLHSFRLL